MRTLPWLATGLGLMLLPKCPACLAAWLAVATGVGVTATAASHLRTVLVALCLAAALFAIVRSRRQCRGRRSEDDVGRWPSHPWRPGPARTKA